MDFSVPFEHWFVSSALRLPYNRLERTLTRYCAVRGLRAILADQGQNDWPETDEVKDCEYAGEAVTSGMQHQ